MQKYLYCLLLSALFTAGEFSSSTERRVTCIDSKFKADIGDEGYTQCYSRNQALPIPKIKQCVTDWMKAKNIVVTARNGQMTVDAAAFASKANELRNKNIGRAMEACKSRNNDDMYREAARATQCIFGEIKETCK